MDPAVALLCLEQRDRSLESHTLDFLELACLTHYPDRSLCVFYISSLSERSRARLPGSGPQKDFAALVEWVLVSNDSPFTVGPAEDDFATSPTPLPEASQPPSTNVTTEMFHVPTADRGGQPTAMDEPGPRKGSDSTIAPEPTSQQGSDQVREPVTSPDGEGLLVELEGWEESSAHNTTTMETMTDTGKYAEELKEPPSPASSVTQSHSQFLSPTISALQPLDISHITDGDVKHLQALHSIHSRRSPASTSSLHAPCSTSARRHFSVTLAPPSLGSTGHHQPYGFSGLPRLSGSALVSRPPACTYGSVWLLLPSSSAYILGPTGSASALWMSASSSDARHHGSSSVSRTIGCAWARRLCSSIWVSS
ncbi:hypothetical protein DPX16_16659 [Anabarilius grahami]|uniref:Uncharacterized protein n=1 Tax=Anabarilius grahami TaxID=495550 RepID=A0A3N0YS91_ANAGA|nr:hypothetical protein DPX16_16659 [Anabarilius grahami]